MFISNSKQTILFNLLGSFGGGEGDLRARHEALPEALPDTAPEGAVILHLALLIHLFLSRLQTGDKTEPYSSIPDQILAWPTIHTGPQDSVP